MSVHPPTRPDVAGVRLDPHRTFWAARCSGSAKRASLLGLVSCFILVSVLVYSDPASNRPLSPRAEAGRRIWHARNCQSCHQLYGFGGFLGPDLTNASPWLTPQRLERVLVEGSGLMPAFALKAYEIDALDAFLGTMDVTGQGQARDPRLSRSSVDPRRLADAIADKIAAAGPAQVAFGHGLFVTRGCRGCHTLGDSRPQAPDLMTVADRMSGRQIIALLETGRMPGMPPAPLSDPEREAVHDFLRWLGDWSQPLMADVVDGAERGIVISGIPWWEYR